MLTVAFGPLQRTQVLGPGLKHNACVHWADTHVQSVQLTWSRFGANQNRKDCSSSGVNVEITLITGFLQCGRNSDAVMETLKCVTLVLVDPQAGSPPCMYRFKGS